MICVCSVLRMGLGTIVFFDLLILTDEGLSIKVAVYTYNELHDIIVL